MSTQPQTQETTESNPTLNLSHEPDKLTALRNAVLDNTDTDSPDPELEEVEVEQTLKERLAEAEKPDTGAEKQPSVKSPKSLDALADSLGVEVKDLFGIEIGMPGDGEKLTLGQLKDSYDTQSTLTDRELEFEQAKVKYQHEQVQAQQDLQTILKALPPEAIKPEILAKARAEREVFLDREAARVLDVIPEWNSPDTKKQDMDVIYAHMKNYGFDKSQVDQIAEHQMVRFMRDSARLQALVDKARGAPKKVKKVPKGSQKAPAQKKPAKVLGTNASKSDKIAAMRQALLTQGK